MAQNAGSTMEKQNGTKAISLNPETLLQLNSLVASTEALSQAGYVVKKLTNADLDQKKRCPSCRLRSKSLAISTRSELLQ